ncbi:hypothetical protein MTP99_004174 [Tenebrio molitor]|nr:hypothetical protein MTP99_004174 [Tenebrio molitor]
MSLQRLQVICNVGKCFALFPSTSDVKPVTQCQKIFAIMMSSMATIWMVICMSNKNFYTYYIHIKMIVCLLTDITLLSIYVTGVIDVTFRKRDQWSKLMKNLKIIHNGRKIKYFTSFLMAQGIYFITMGVTTFSFYEIQGVRYFREFSCSMALIYTKYLQKLFLYVILKMTAETYRSLGQQLRSLMVKSNTQHITVVLRRIKYFAEVLKDTVNIFNGIFGWPITLILTFTILHLLNYLDYTFIAITNLDEMFVMKYIISDIMMIVFNLASTVYVIYLCDDVVKEAEGLLEVSCRLRWNLGNLTSEEKRDLYWFTDFLKDNFPKFSAARFFHIDRSTVLGILGTTTTFFIIMIQFNSSASSYYY